MIRLAKMRRLLVLLMLVLFVVPGCSSRTRYNDPYEPESIERPARPIGEEDTISDKAGKILVAVVVVGIALGSIAVGVLFGTGTLP